MNPKRVNSKRYFWGPKAGFSDDVRSPDYFRGITWDRDKLPFFSDYSADFSDDASELLYLFDNGTYNVSSDSITFDGE